MARCLRCKAGPEWIEGDAPRHASSLRELVARLRDELTEGLKYDSKRQIYTLLWTPRQVRNARRRAKRLWLKINATDRTGAKDGS